MNMRTQIASVVGHATEYKWGQVLHTPFAFGVIEIHTHEKNARQEGIEALSKLSALFDVAPVSLVDLERIADQIKNEHIVSLVLLIPVGSVLYLVCRGSGSVYIRREQKLARLLTDEQSLSGNVKVGDTIIAASKGFVSTLKDQDILGAFDHLSPDEVAEKLTLLLHEHDGGDGGAALIFHIDDIPGAVSVLRASDTKKNHLKSFVHIKSIIMTKIKRVIPRLRHMVRNLTFKKMIPLIFVGLFIMSVVLGLIHQHSVRTNNTTLAQVKIAQQLFDEGVALADINPVKGRERLSEAREMLGPLYVESPKNEEQRAVALLYQQVLEHITRALHSSEVEPQIYFDVSLLKSGGAINEASFFEDSLGLFDTKGNTIYSLKTDTKNGAVVGGGALFTNGAKIAAYNDRYFVLTAKGIHIIRLADQKTTAEIIKSSDQWGTIADMSVYGGNLYLLDSLKSRIWKYTATTDGFTQIREYLDPDFFPDLSKATNMAIDGSIWLGTSNGEIIRFTQGRENSFTPQGAEPPLGNLLNVYVSDDIVHVYVLDHEHKRIVVFDKDGLYLSQYVWSSELAPTQFFVHEKQKKIFLVAQGKLYFIDLQ